ncbi:MAG: outer membrane protein assembly factor BamE [Gammaproteobacteria bacterium]
MRLTSLICLLFLLAACSAPRMPSLGNLPGPDDLPFIHRIDVQQGNVVTQDMLAQLRRGMDKKKVTFVMGSPIVQDTFNADRWDYIYTHQAGRDQPERRLVTLYFVDDKLDRVGGDVNPASGELVAKLHHDLTVRVPRIKRKNFVERMVDKLPFTGDEEQEVEVLSIEEAAADHANATAHEADEAAKAEEAEDELAAIELEQPVPTSPYEDIQAAPGEGVIVPPDAPTRKKKKGFFARLLGGLAADDEDEDKDTDYDAGDPKYRDITDQSNI